MTAFETAMQEAGCRVEMESAERFNRDRFVLYREGFRIGRGTWFRGGRHIRPWIELQPATVFAPDSEEDRTLFGALTAMLEPGSHLMVHYLDDAATAEAITADVPPPATPLGSLLWQGGVRWYKDWYFTEGWMEGDQKLQGNLPLDRDVKQEREQEWRERLQAWVERADAFESCRVRARQILRDLDGS